MGQLLGETLITVKDLTKSFGDREILKNLTFTVHRGARIGILGANGCGKSTFMKLLALEDTEHGGEIRHASGIRVGYVAQEPWLDETKTVRENIEVGLRHIHAIVEEYNQVGDLLGTESDSDKIDKLMARMSRLQEDIEQVGGWEADHMVEVAMEALRVPPAESYIKTHSGGERRRTALCRELISHPDLLILDEPTNHLDASTVEWLENFIDEYLGTVIMVTHDRYFLDNVANYMVEIENGRLNIFEGNYSDYLRQKNEMQEQKARQEERRQRVINKELDWLNSTPQARRTKSKARMSSYEQLLAGAPDEVRGTVNLVIPSGPRLGSKVLRIEGLKKSFGDRVLFDGLKLEMRPGEILGVIGPNGTGKTTLLKMIVGKEKPDAGVIDIGPTVKFSFIDQSREDLDDSRTVYEEISEGRDFIQVGNAEYHIREYLSHFLFKGSQQQTLVGKLSGGERNRVLLAKTLRRSANFLLLDEPTNDLDLPTLRVLEEALETFAGCAIVVSHDRYFLDRIANSLLVFEETGKVRHVDGNYETYFEIRRTELEKSGTLPGKYRRTTYRKMRRK
jgi:sulfate-transporting ATPase